MIKKWKRMMLGNIHFDAAEVIRNIFWHEIERPAQYGSMAFERMTLFRSSFIFSIPPSPPFSGTQITVCGRPATEQLRDLSGPCTPSPRDAQ
jgi:hypothetical protein